MSWDRLRESPAQSFHELKERDRLAVGRKVRLTMELGSWTQPALRLQNRVGEVGDVGQVGSLVPVSDLPLLPDGLKAHPPVARTKHRVWP